MDWVFCANPIITLAAISAKRNVTVWCPSVRPSVRPVIFLALTECAAHTQRHSPEARPAYIKYLYSPGKNPVATK